MSDADHLEIYEFSRKVAFSIRRRWCNHMNEREAISAAYFGIVCVIGTRPISSMYLRARGAILNEIYWLRSGRKKQGHGYNEEYDDESTGHVDGGFAKIEWDSELLHAHKILKQMRPQRADIILSHASGESSEEIARRLGQKPSSVSAALGIAHREARLLRDGKKLIRIRKNGKRILMEVSL